MRKRIVGERAGNSASYNKKLIVLVSQNGNRLIKLFGINMRKGLAEIMHN